MAGIFTEVWINELVEAFRRTPTFLDGVPDYSSRVAPNMTLHLTEIGADPNVLINNNSYPIAVANRADSDLPFALDKFDTENTRVTDDEIGGLAYDKIKSVQEGHVLALVEATGDKALHSIAPASDTVDTPVIVTIAATFGPKDLVALKKRFDDAGVPKEGRRIVLCSEHIEGLLNSSESFAKQYNLNNTEGQVARLYGFEIKEYNYNPVYNLSSKAAFGAAPAGGDKNSSIAFWVRGVAKADGGTAKQFMQNASDDPLNRENLIGYRFWHFVTPKSLRAIGAILSQ